MKIISHRGNLSGHCSINENSPDYIQEALDIGFDVEIDVWFHEDQLFLGHDSPEYKTSLQFLQMKIMVSCKKFTSTKNYDRERHTLFLASRG